MFAVVHVILSSLTVILSAIFVILSVAKEPPALAQTSPHLDYAMAEHTIEITSLRSGNHDPDNKNQYYFTVKAIALNTQKAERKRDLAQRKKLERPLGVFGEMEVLPLIPVDLKDKGATFTISGETIRELVSEAMRDLNGKEFEISVNITVDMFEKNKFLFFFGDDTKLGSVNYFVIQDSRPHELGQNPGELKIADDKGLLVTFAVKFKPAPPTNPEEDSPSEAPAPTGG
jgi:hypothetical protein